MAFAGTKALRGEGGISLSTPRGRIDVVAPAAFTGRYGIVAPDVSRGARLAAIRFAVADASLLQNAPELAGMAGLDAGGAAVIGPQVARGATLIFEKQA